MGIWSSLVIDNSEPDDIKRMIEPVLDFDVKALNMERWADYFWVGEKVSHWKDHDGSYQLERKTWGDLAAGIEGVETQLREQQQIHPRAYHRLLIEGAIEPHPAGVQVYSRQQGKSVMTPKLMGRPGSYASIMGRVAGWYEFLEVWMSATYPSTASTICELYKRDQKPEDERETFQKQFKEITFHPNVQVSRLMGLAGKDTNIGQEKADDLIATFGTVWNVVNKRPEELAVVKGISVQGAKVFLQKIGRLDV